MSFLSRYLSMRQLPRLETVRFEDSRGLALDLRDSLPSPLQPNTDLRERVREVWRRCRTDRGGFPENFDQGPETAIYFKDWRWNLGEEKVQDGTRPDWINALCTDLGLLASRPDHHFENLDEKLLDHLVCIFKSDLAEDLAEEEVDFSSLDTAPSPTVWPTEYFLTSTQKATAGASSLVSSAAPWEELKVASRMNTSSITLAIQIVVAPRAAYNVGRMMQIRLNFISELLDLIKASPTTSNGLSGCGKYILLTYLWTDWQRSMMLLMYHVLGNELMSGNDSIWTDILVHRGNSVLDLASNGATLDGSCNPMSRYMCPWAFELLKRTRSSLGLDFRVFHERFTVIHGNQPARCLFGSDEACDGSHPLACGIFADQRLVADEQSMHDYTCSKKCNRIIWNERSYRSISGPRAVVLRRNTSLITYCKASEQTMAVSHVWSHGQGGRPDTGINRCLHDRYRRIAKRQGCDSYWIDTVCIPEAHDLRKEAIRYINQIFSTSKVTLVCDRDLMKIDLNNISRNLELLESIVSTFLVCDWNVRAWTLLEGFQANHSLRLLCKNNETLSLRETWARVYLEGRIDLAVVSLTVRHLLPKSSNAFNNSRYRKQLEFGGSLLSHRHASRDGDDIVIWTLLSDFQISDTAAAMWKHRIGRKIKTGYLMTRTDRTQNVRGFSWAPSSPYVRRPSNVSGQPTNSQFLPLDGEGSESGMITAKGLRAIWLVHDVDEIAEKSYNARSSSVIPENANITYSAGTSSRQYLRNECWETAISLRKCHKWVRLLQAKSDRGATPYWTASDGDETHGPLIAICTADIDDFEDACWHWNGVYEWPGSIPLPRFSLDDLLLG